LFGETNDNTPAKVLVLSLDVYKPSRHQKWQDILRFGDDLSYLIINLQVLILQLLLSLYYIFVWNFDLFEFSKFTNKLFLELWA